MYIVLQLGLMLWLPVLYYKVLHLHRLHAVTWKTIEFILLSEHTHSHTQKALSESWLNIIECISRNSTDIQYMIIINWGVVIRCFTTRIQPLLIQSLYSSTHCRLVTEAGAHQPHTQPTLWRRLTWVAILQQAGQWEQYLAHIECRGPLVLQNVQAHHTLGHRPT